MCACVCVVVSYYMRQLLEAVGYCHDHAIIHRNIQPQFVVVATSGSSSPIKLTGFSVSLQLGLSDSVLTGLVIISLRKLSHPCTHIQSFSNLSALSTLG